MEIIELYLQEWPICRYDTLFLFPYLWLIVSLFFHRQKSAINHICHRLEWISDLNSTLGFQKPSHFPYYHWINSTNPLPDLWSNLCVPSYLHYITTNSCL